MCNLRPWVCNPRDIVAQVGNCFDFIVELPEPAAGGRSLQRNRKRPYDERMDASRSALVFQCIFIAFESVTKLIDTFIGMQQS